MPLSEDHFPYAWAAYKRGSFDKSPLFPKDMDVAEFTAKLADITMGMMREGHEMAVGLAQIPVVLISIEYNDNVAVPHAAWFPEATPRNKLELALKLFIDLKKGHLVLTNIISPKSEKSTDVKFHEHLCNYGVLRRVGTIRDYYGANMNGVLFQSVGN